ncbi:Peptidase M28 domain containing protein [Asbolus verrucosus]|uniref:Glutaminyl-peptide cyclotransferase n=1 Tax=Asbolus verrucosus TaxID=1661398 RepID=A0A482VP55_ASBVE|nr:Peptidase M28 domain containing protein [Asbolus verrucosus]
MPPLLITLALFTIVLTTGLSNRLKAAREEHRPQLSTNSDFRYLATLTDSNHINKILDNILIPRVVGTENHEKVFRYIVKELRRLKWHVDVDEFVDKTPLFGELTFKNIVATPNPLAERFLVLACHYDSKYFKNDIFVGAIDSAVPCAMMLNIAATLSKDINRNKSSDLALKLIFFDGEEAFIEWGPHDSIYGAKHLARELHNNKTEISRGEIISELDRVDLLVLLDLIGAKNPVFLNYFPETQKWFVRLAQIERELDLMNILKNHRFAYFQSNRPYGRIEDDHIPFLKRGVPILHLISTPFPREWHTPGDNRDIIDMDTVNNVNLILKTFISEYLHLLV